MIDRNLQHCPFTSVTPIEKLVPVCAGQLNQLFNWFFNSKLCEKKENWTAVVQHWLLGNQTGSVSMAPGQVSVFFVPTSTSRLADVEADLGDFSLPCCLERWY